MLALDGREWLGILAYATVEPFGPVRDDLRAGEITAAVYNSQGVRARPADFFSTLREPVKGEGTDACRAAFVRMCPALSMVYA